MAVRTATRRWADLGAFLREYPQTLKLGALVLPVGTVDGEPAPEMKIDLMLPLVGRVGPVTAQIVAQLPDGGVAMRIAGMPDKVQESIDGVFSSVEQVRAWLLETGQVAPAGGVPREEIVRLEARIRELESRPAAIQKVTASAPAAAAAATGPVERGLPVPDVSDVDPALSGSLADRSLRDAFMALAIEKMTGLLTFQYKDRIRWGFWNKGGPVAWRTEPVDPEEVLGVLLFRGGSITKEQLAQSLEVMEQRNCRQGEALIEMGLITFPQLVVMLQKQTEFVLNRVLQDREGSWTFHPLAELPERFVAPPVRVAALMYRAMLAHVKSMPAEDLASSLRPLLDKYVFLAPGVEKTFEEMKLKPDEQQFTQIIGKTSFRLREVFAVSSLSRSGTASAIWVLNELNLVEFRDEGDVARTKEAIAREMKSRKSQMAGTFFDRLELHWICTGDEVEAGYRKMKPLFTPDTVPKWGEEYRPLLETISQKIEEAYKALNTDAKRREYRLSIIERDKIEQSAEMLSKQGEMGLMKEAKRDALSCWSKAAELVPNNASYQAGLKRAKALPDPAGGL